MIKVRKLFSEAERGVTFSLQDAKNAGKHLEMIVLHSGIEKIIDFFRVLNILCLSVSRRKTVYRKFRGWMRH